MADANSSYELNNPPVIAETLEGEIVAIDLDAGNYYSVRGIAAAIWSALSAGMTPEAIAGTAANGEARADLLPMLLAFVDRLMADGLMRLRTSAPAAAAQAMPAAWTAGDLTYETYTDMQNLLGLDPVHEADDQLGWPAPAAPTAS